MKLYLADLTGAPSTLLAGGHDNHFASPFNSRAYPSPSKRRSLLTESDASHEELPNPRRRKNNFRTEEMPVELHGACSIEDEM